MEELEEDLTCSVCYSLFSDPRVLPCSHTFCRICLEQVLQASVSVSVWRPLRLPLKCPSCRSVVELPSNGVDAMPLNVCLRAIVEKYQRDRRPPTCPEHPRQPLNVYCVQNRQLICGFCLTTGQHQGHAIDDLQTAVLKERGARGRLAERLEGQRWDEVCGRAERLAQERERSRALLQSERQAVSRFFQSLDLILAQKEQQCMQAVERAAELLDRAYDPLVQQLKDMQEEHTQLLSLSSSVESEECPLEYLEQVHQLSQRVNAVMQTPLPEIPSMHLAPRVESFLQEHWSELTITALRDAPVPDISWSSAEGAGPRRGPPAPALLIIIITLLLTALCVVSVCGAPPALSELTQMLHQMGTALFCLLQSISTFTSSVGEDIYQHLLSFLKTLH